LQTVKMFFRDQEGRLAAYLADLKSLPLSYSEITGLPENTIRSAVGTACDLEACDLGFLFHYDVFPPPVLKFFGEWQLHERAMRVGDVIVQQVQIPPGRAGLKLLFGVRVLSVYHSPEAAGFRYGTLQGYRTMRAGIPWRT
jgi:hypothetical protein